MTFARFSDLNDKTEHISARTLHEQGLRHQAVAKMILDTLRIETLQAFHGLARFLNLKLSPGECRGLAMAALLACKEEDGMEVVELVFPDLFGAGMPPAPLTDDEMDLDAELWASVATVRELRACLAAAYRRLPAQSRDALLAQLEKEAAE